MGYFALLLAVLLADFERSIGICTIAPSRPEAYLGSNPQLLSSVQSFHQHVCLLLYDISEAHQAGWANDFTILKRKSNKTLTIR